MTKQQTRTRPALAVASVSPNTVKKTASKKTDKPVPVPTKLALKLVGDTSKTDVNGSYTGRPIHHGEKPVQDADDL